MRTAAARAPIAFLSFRWMLLPREGYAKNSASGGLGTLRCSLWNLLLSIEMNTKPALSSIKTIQFRHVSFHINDIPARVIVFAISLAIPPGETLVLRARGVSTTTPLLTLLHTILLPARHASPPTA